MRRVLAEVAPEALQVADRFHILCNLTQTLQRLLERLAVAVRRSPISEAVPAQDSSSASITADAATTAMPARNRSSQVEPTSTTESATAGKKEGALRSRQSRVPTWPDPTGHRTRVRPIAEDGATLCSGYKVSRAGAETTPHCLGTVSRIPGEAVGRRLPQRGAPLARTATAGYTGQRSWVEGQVHGLKLLKRRRSLFSLAMRSTDLYPVSWST
jgi:hypothetical protein